MVSPVGILQEFEQTASAIDFDSVVRTELLFLVLLIIGLLISPLMKDSGKYSLV